MNEARLAFVVVLGIIVIAAIVAAGMMGPIMARAFTLRLG